MKTNNICIQCGSIIPDEDEYCGNCGTHRPVNRDNYCINQNCERFKKVLANPTQEFCGKCGKPTSFGNQVQKLT